MRLSTATSRFAKTRSGRAWRYNDFPAISTGIFGYPADDAARVAVTAVAETLPRTGGITQVIFCCFDEASAERHRRALAELEG